ncbi:DUF4279 domain-containing protein [Photobacterium swingsii]|uniref:DUF4279 domain-containing protein n=1 Tax=Photobacterium swingsii TaxID=680026 RepID=UPI003D0FAF0B
MKAFVRLKILTSEHTSTELSDLIGMSSDRSWSKGDLRYKTKITEKKHGWLIESRMHETQDVENQINEIFSRIDKSFDKISSLPDDMEVLLSVVIYANEIPALYFNKEIIKKVADIRANFDIDLYSSG